MNVQPPPPAQPSGPQGQAPQAPQGQAPQVPQGQFQQAPQAEKSTGIAYLLLFVMSGIGAHQFYIGNMKKAGIFIGLFLCQSFFMTLGSIKATKVIEMKSIVLKKNLDALSKAKTPQEMKKWAGNAGLSPKQEARMNKVQTKMFILFGMAGLFFLIYLGFWFVDLFTLGKQIDAVNRPQMGGVRPPMNTAA